MNSPQLHMALAHAKADDLRRAAAARNPTPHQTQPGPPAAADRSVTLRFAGPADENRLARLAALDSSPPPAHPILLAEVDGQLLAALTLSARAVIADPFHPTAELIDLLRTRADQLEGSSPLRRSRRLRSRAKRRSRWASAPSGAQ
jgi:hypothetical protein